MKLRALACFLAALALAGCGTAHKSGPTAGGGGYYKDDGPGANPPPDLDNLPDAIPRIEPLAVASNRPYVVFGERYVPITAGERYRQRGIASWYGKKFHGGKTSNGETYDMYAMTAAHPTLPIPSYARVTRVATGRSVVVRINDRGPFHSDRIIDLSYAAAHKLGLIGPGSGEVIVEQILPQDIERTAAASAATAALPAGPATDAPASSAPAGGTTPASPLPPGMPPTQDPPVSTPPTPLPAPAAPVAARPAGGSGVFLQLGAFSQADNARSLAARVQGVLGGSAPGIDVVQGGSLYRVKVGPYADREAAMSAVQDISTRTGILPSLAMP